MWDLILDFLFPKKCVSCGKQGTWLCKECVAQISLSETPFLRLVDSNLQGLIAIAYFKNPLKEAIHAFKYDGIREILYPLSKLCVQHLLDKRLKFVRGFIIVPMPLHKSRENERGFNQAALLAQEIAKKLNFKILEGVLIRIRKTQAQIELKEKERRKNMKGAFAFLGDKKLIKNKKILLIDDVSTTGSTLNEAAKVLKKAGAKIVWGLVLAKD